MGGIISIFSQDAMLLQAPAEIAILGAIFALVDLVIDIKGYHIFVNLLRLVLKLGTMSLLFYLLGTIPMLGAISLNFDGNSVEMIGFMLIMITLVPYFTGRFVTLLLVSWAMGKRTQAAEKGDNRKEKVMA